MIDKAKTFLHDIFRKGFFHLLVANFFVQIVAFASQFFVAWILPAVEIGRIRILQTYGGTASVVAKLGFDASLLKLCSEDRPENEKRRYLWVALAFVAPGAVAVIVFLMAGNVAGLLTTDERLRHLFFYYLPILLAMSLSDIFVLYLQALKKVEIMAKAQVFTRMLNLALIVVATYFFSTLGYVLALVIGTFGGMLWLYHVVTRGGRISRASPVLPYARNHWNYARFSVAANLVGQLNTYLEVFLLNYLVNDRVGIGYYGFALTLLIPYLTITTTVQQLTTPYFSEKSSDIREWHRMYRKHQRLLILGTLAIAAVSYVMVPPVITFIFSHKYDSSLPLFLFLLLGWVVRNMYSLKGIALWGLGYINYNLYIVLAALPINCVLTYLCITRYSVTGAAVANVLSQAVILVIVTFVFRSIALKRAQA